MVESRVTLSWCGFVAWLRRPRRAAMAGPKREARLTVTSTLHRSSVAVSRESHVIGREVGNTYEVGIPISLAGTNA